MTIRSHQLGWITSNVNNASGTMYTVPAGFRALIKSLFVGNSSSTVALPAFCWVQTPGATKVSYMFQGTLTVAQTLFLVPGVVLNPGESIGWLRGVAAGPYLTLLASGVELANP